MKKLFFVLVLLVASSTIAKSNGQDTLWIRTTTAGVQDLDFTPDDKYVLAWTNAIEFWNVETGTMDFIVPNVKVGGMTSDKKYLVFIQDDVPKLLDLKTREIVEGFEPPPFKPNKVKVGHDSNIFMCSNEKDSLFIWDIGTKKIVKVFSKPPTFIEKGDEFDRKIEDYGFAGNNDDFIFISTLEENRYATGHPNKVFRLSSQFYNRNDFTLFDSLAWIGKYKPMNLNKDEIAIDKYDGTISFYNVRNKETINTIKYENIKVYVADFEFSEDDNFICIAYGGYIKVFDLNNSSNYFYFNVGTYHECKLSKNKTLLAGSVGSYLILHPSLLTLVDDLISEKKNEILILPNPSNLSIHISYEFPIITKYKFSLYDVNGNILKVIDENQLSNLNYNKDFNISFLFRGVYFVRLEYDGTIVNKQFVKE